MAFATDENALGQAVSPSAAPTLDELKAVGASKSTYRTQMESQDSAETLEADLVAFAEVIQPLLDQACVRCHGPETQEGHIRIDTLDPDLLRGKDVNWWLEVLAVVSNGEMPPPDDGALADEHRSQVVEWLSEELKKASAVRREKGSHSSFRRMTRYEYNYALQDILGLPFDFAKDLPPEPNSEDGFQNSSELLHMSVQQFDSYRRIARKALKRAIVIGERPPVLHWGITMREAASMEWPKQAERIDQLKEKFKDDPEKQTAELDKLTTSFKSPHRNTYYRELSTERTARPSWQYYGAKYAFNPVDSRPQLPESFDTVAVIPHGRNQHLIVELGDQLPDQGTMRVRVRASRLPEDDSRNPSLQLDFGWRASNEGRAVMRVSSEDVPIQASSDQPEIYQWDIPLGEIYPRNSVRGRSKMGEMPSPSEYIRLVNSSASASDLQLDYVEVAAPVYDQWPPESHQRIFFDSENDQNEAVYAKQIISAFMSRAWRRPIEQDEICQKLKLYRVMREDCETFEDAIIEVLATILSSPNFLYVVQEKGSAVTVEQTADVPAQSPSLSATELATRLSLFLWCSVPDERLLELASSGQLSDPEILEAQVKRMLADDRSKRFAKHFVHQWLDMQLLDFLNINAQVPHFDPLLKEAMQQEPIEFFREILRGNESVLNFIHADFTMANERLAQHYRLPDVYGNHFRRVRLDASHRRGGLLTQAGLLAMNSAGIDSHPLKRGVWLLESILNDPPPPPPPAVPEIDLADPEIAKLTLKQRIENHRDHAACMSCHAKIDPWGIAFENYDALGLWRNEIQGQPVDASSHLFNQQEIRGMDGLKRYLLEHRQDQFLRSMVHKMTTYALGRPLTFVDRAGVDRITAKVREEGDGLSTMIRLLVTSESFQDR